MTKYRLAEQARRLLNLPVSFQQELMILANQAFATVVKASLFAAKQTEGVMEVNGSFIYSFDKVAVLKDDNKKMYYATLPSTSVDLPLELGINHVSLQESQDEPFVRIPSGAYGLFSGLKCYNMEGRKKYFSENNRLYFPDFLDTDKINYVMIKLVVALNDLSEDAELAIPPDVELAIVQMIGNLYQKKDKPENPLKE